MEKEYIEWEEFNRIKGSALIIDVRDKLEHQTLKSLPNSINIPYQELISEPEKYLENKNQLIIIYCNYGNRSGKATYFLREKGYRRVFVLKGGIYLVE
ncbi:MAG: rhodanese-like domain-containing protein [Candidatus Moeniiplasma glomeromycotorum]|nr:rhodanese-like domain-containing protein [Candidatus Moeniiplasma glomeromycotorum]